ncbi:Superoxide dismutase-like protein YojM [Burkholderiales bacterium]|nr:Superoxide dismutase-like protein YojM [Burkholderiales bacterium]
MKHAMAIAAAVTAWALAGCATTPFDTAVATAKLEPTRGNATAGTVTFAERMGRVVVTAEVTGLAPGREHGFHVHEKGDCSSGDGMSTGGHFNPDARPHGPQDAAHHAGDMPNLRADADGRAKASFTLEGVSVRPGPKSLAGRGLIVHKDADDYRTQPTGNAGARLACAVIRAS